MRAILLMTGLALSVEAPALAQSTSALLAADQGTHLDVVAHFTGSTWAQGTADQPIPREWTRWYAPGPSVPIRLSSTQPAGRCATPRKLPVANPPSRSVRRGGAGYVGIATSGSIPIEPMTPVTETSSEWGAISAAVAALFERRARDHSITPATLGRVPMAIDAVYAIERGSERAAYYFEASKRVPDAGNTPEDDPKGIVRIAVSGWLRSTGERLVPVATKSELHWEPADERPGLRPTLLPLGVLRQGGERIWVMNGQMGTRETITLYALTASAVRTLLTVDASAC